MTTDPYDVASIPPTLGVIVEAERGSLPFALIPGEALVACAAWALGGAGITPVDTGTTWAALVESDEALVLHDALCPMTPASFLADCVRVSAERSAVVGAVRPVTDTVKQVEEGYVGATIDRDELVAQLRRRFPVELVQAPPEARRVGSAEDIRVLEALTVS